MDIATSNFPGAYAIWCRGYWVIFCVTPRSRSNIKSGYMRWCTINCYSSFVFNFILWKQSLYKSYSSNLITYYSFSDQIIHVWCLYKNILKTVHSKIRTWHLTPYQLGITCSLTSTGQHSRYWCLVQFPLKEAHANACTCAHWPEYSLLVYTKNGWRWTLMTPLRPLAPQGSCPWNICRTTSRLCNTYPYLMCWLKYCIQVFNFQSLV